MDSTIVKAAGLLYVRGDLAVGNCLHLYFRATLDGGHGGTMLSREGSQRTIEVDLRLAIVLGGVAGAVNAAGFQAMGFFSANMTGNASAFSADLGLGRMGSAWIFAALILVFIAGATISGLFIEVGRKQHVAAIYAYSIVFEAALLLLLGIAAILMPGSFGGPPTALGLSFVMGIQNAATTRISNARVRTTHVSGMMTDIGLSLATIINRSEGRDVAIDRLRLYGATVSAFLLGGLAGVSLYLRIGDYLLPITAVLLLAIALPEANRAKERQAAESLARAGSSP